MTRILKEVTISLSLLRILAFTAIFLISSGGHAIAGHKTVAKINGTELDELVLQEELNRLYPGSYFHGTSALKKKAALRPQALKNIIEDELLYQEAKRMKLKVDKKRIDESHKAKIRELGGKKAFKSILKQSGISEKQYLKTLEKHLLIDMIIENEVKQKTKVTDSDIAKHYEENKKSYLRPASRRLWHVLIKVNPAAPLEDKLNKRKRAEEVLKMAKEEGADLFQIAWNYSDGSYNVKGGDLGLVHMGSLVPSVDEVAFSLEQGQISEVIDSIYGYHIVKVITIEKPKQLSLQDVYESIKREFQESRETQAMNALISRLREKAVIEVYEEGTGN